MSSKDIESQKIKIQTAIKSRPHVVVLGAGASRASCPEGDKNGNILPLMDDFTTSLQLESLLNEWNIDPNQNFEEIFSDLHEKQESKKIQELETRIESYFKKLELPETPTVYDHLVLSLREQDIIATFNWDPLLLQAYCRNGNCGLELPPLVFLHGNVNAGFCKQDKRAGLMGNNCSMCQNAFVATPLLYPIKKKNYSQDTFIVQEWERLKWGFENAIMFTIFGYSGPKTDVVAIEAMKKAWGETEKRQFEQTHFISNKTEDEVYDNWKEFIHTHHYSVWNNFYESYIGRHPRRTQEAYYHQYLGAEFLDNMSIPQNCSFEELWSWYDQFKESENDEDNLKTFSDVL